MKIILQLVKRFHTVLKTNALVLKITGVSNVMAR